LMTIVKFCYFTGGFLLLLICIFSVFGKDLVIMNRIYVHLWEPLKYFDPFFRLDFFIRGGLLKVSYLASLIIALLLFVSVYIITKRPNFMGFNAVSMIIIITICSSMVWFVEYYKYSKRPRSAYLASSYLDVQRWAKRHTSPMTLFMPDPSHYYGWRDFSERSSFGNLREWGYCAIAYNPDRRRYLEGKKRMKEFGIDINKITYEDLKTTKYSIYGQELIRDIRERFYSMSVEELKCLSNKYKINYIVMKKKFQTRGVHEFKVAYENKFYIVYEPL